MPLTLVLAFHRVAAVGSFTAAARTSGVSQPTLSAQVKALEHQIGAALFDRRGRAIRLTALGQELFEVTSRLDQSIAAVDQVINGTRALTRGTLRICADSAVHALPILAALKQQHGAFNFSIRIDNSADVLARVLAGEADVGITARRPSKAGLYAVLIRTDRLALVVPKGDSLARRKLVRLSELAGRDVIMREKGSMTREVADAGLAAAHTKPRQVLEVATREAVQEAVAAGFGVGLGFASEVGGDSRLKSLALQGSGLSVAEYAVCLVEQKGRGRVARFLAMGHRIAQEKNWLA
jgi:LysR family transcriptional regulator, low CO2-responsive transcriptional regulator